MQDSVTACVRLKSDIYDKLQLKADSLGVSCNTIIRIAVSKYLEE